MCNTLNNFGEIIGKKSALDLINYFSYYGILNIKWKLYTQYTHNCQGGDLRLYGKYYPKLPFFLLTSTLNIVNFEVENEYLKKDVKRLTDKYTMLSVNYNKLSADSAINITGLKNEIGALQATLNSPSTKISGSRKKMGRGRKDQMISITNLTWSVFFLCSLHSSLPTILPPSIVPAVLSKPAVSHDSSCCRLS